MASAEDLVSEFTRRRIDARRGQGSTVVADINNVDMQVHFDDSHLGDIAW